LQTLAVTGGVIGFYLLPDTNRIGALGLPKESLHLAEGLKGAPAEYPVDWAGRFFGRGRPVQDSTARTPCSVCWL